MRKHFYLGLVAAMALASCSDDNVNEPTNVNGISDGVPRYLAVSLVATPEGGSRAGEGDKYVTGDPNNSTDYEAGEAFENKVQRVRFYFFTANDGIANVKGSETRINYYDWKSPAVSDGNMPATEKKIDATIVINTTEGDELPQKILAVVNPPASLLNDTGSKSLADLKGITDNYTALAIASKENDAAEGEADNTNYGFVMLNSVYAAGSTAVEATTIESSNLCTSKDDAEDNPVTIYVERNVAKVRLNWSGDAKTALGNNSYMPLKDKDGNALTDSLGNQVYLQITGWRATATSKKSYLLKHINPNWTDANLFGTSEPWNWAPYFRSFWAINPTVSGGNDDYFTYNQISSNNIIGTEQYKSATVNGKTNYIYVEEDAMTDAAKPNEVTLPTKIILAGKLGTLEEGTLTAYKRYNYMGIDYTSQGNMLTAMANFINLYKVTTVTNEDETTSTVYTHVTPEDLVLKTALELGAPDVNGTNKPVDETESTKGRYYVYAQIKDALVNDANIKWSTTNTATGIITPESTVAATLKTKAMEAGHAKVWETGYTYYYFDIQHLAEKAGVVRNHLYEVSLNSIAGWGTPVFDPDETIYPEKPEPETDTYIAAQIYILPWRVVPSTEDLAW